MEDVGDVECFGGFSGQESRQLCSERRLFCLAAYMQSQTASVNCQKWEKTSPSVEPTSNAYNCMSVAEEKAVQRNKGMWEEMVNMVPIAGGVNVRSVMVAVRVCMNV